MFFSLTIATLASILIAYWLFNYLKWKRELYDVIEKIPGPKRLPVFGTTYLVLGVNRKDIFKTITHNINKYKPFFRTWVGTKPWVQLTKPHHLELIMSNSTHITKSTFYTFLKPWLGDGLLISSGAKWHQRRKMITPTFHFKILENFMEVFVEKSGELIDLLASKTGESFDIYPDITNCALDIICETAMGVKVNAMSDKENKYIKALYNISELTVKRGRKPWLQSNLYYLFPEGKSFQKNLSILHGFTEEVIADRRKILRENPNKKSIDTDDISMSKKKRLSFLDLLLDASENDKFLTDTDIREEVDTFMFEGHDTTTAAMCWSLFLLANHPEIQEKAYEEVKSVLQEKKTPETVADLHELKYLECCVKEALRIFPSVPFISRQLSDDVVIDGYRVPKGVQCNLLIYTVHHDPEIYPEPEKFDPDRFLPENSLKRHPYAFVPFSAGPRNCIGQKFAMYEEKTILASIIRNFRLLPVDTFNTINIVSELILRPENGVSIILEKRKT